MHDDVEVLEELHPTYRLGCQAGLPGVLLLLRLYDRLALGMMQHQRCQVDLSII